MKKASVTLLVIAAVALAVFLARDPGSSDEATGEIRRGLVGASSGLAQAAPSDDRSSYATISIPRLGLSERIYFPGKLNLGPTWWNRTARPGDGDTIAVAGHRTTYTRPFLRLNDLHPGDRIVVTWRGDTYVYRVRHTRVFPSSNLHIADSVGYERLLLTACARADGSPTSLDYRIVVWAKPA